MENINDPEKKKIDLLSRVLPRIGNGNSLRFFFFFRFPREAKYNNVLSDLIKHM